MSGEALMTKTNMFYPITEADQQSILDVLMILRIIRVVRIGQSIDRLNCVTFEYLKVAKSY